MLSNTKTYKVRKADLLSKLRENRARHVEIFLAAKDAYRDKVTEALKARLALVQAGKPFHLGFHNLLKPISHESDYTGVIGILEMTTDDHVDITPADYRCYVQDDWDWQRPFKMSAASYVGNARAGLGDEDEVIGSE